RDRGSRGASERACRASRVGAGHEVRHLGRPAGVYRARVSRARLWAARSREDSWAGCNALTSRGPREEEPMDLYAILDQVIALLRQRQRVTYRALKVHFQVDDDALEALKEELIEAQHLAADEAGRMLVWVGDAGTTAPASSPSAATQDQVPLAYTPAYLAEKILTSKSAMEGERKQVTVLFADLKGSTELIRDLDPEQARAILDPALHAMMEAVHRYEGTVNQVLGDGIM